MEPFSTDGAQAIAGMRLATNTSTLELSSMARNEGKGRVIPP